MASLRNIVWFGLLATDEAILGNGAVSPAACNWQRDLLFSLKRIHINSYVIGHLPERAWPYGRLTCPRTSHEVLGIQSTLVRYLNFPLLRNPSIVDGYLAYFDQYCKDYGVPDVVFTYNATRYNVAVAKHIQDRRKVPWVCIVADTPASSGEYEKYVKRMDTATGTVFLPWYNYQLSASRHKIHLDGGISELRFANTALGQSSGKRRIVFYSGNLHPRKGINLLLDAFMLIDSDDTYLWICGRGDNEHLEYLSAIHPRIKLFGLVPEDTLRNLARQADIFVNPRDSSVPDNSTNFPSKLLEYLSYGKPIISTRTLGLSPEYNDLLVFLDEETSLSLANKIIEILDWDEHILEKLQSDIQSFYNSRKSWILQASKLADWVNEFIVG